MLQTPSAQSSSLRLQPPSSAFTLTSPTSTVVASAAPISAAKSSASIIGRTPQSKSHKNALQTRGGLMTPKGRYVAPSLLQELHPQRAADRFLPTRGGQANPAMRADTCTDSSGRVNITTCSEMMDQIHDIQQQQQQQENTIPQGRLAQQLQPPSSIDSSSASAAAAALDRATRVQMLGHALMDLQRSGRAPSLMTSTVPATLVPAPTQMSAVAAVAAPMSPIQIQQEFYLRPSVPSNPMSAFTSARGSSAAFTTATTPISESKRRRASMGSSQNQQVAHASSAPVSSGASPAAAITTTTTVASSRTRKSFPSAMPSSSSSSSSTSRLLQFERPTVWEEGVQKRARMEQQQVARTRAAATAAAADADAVAAALEFSALQLADSNSSVLDFTLPSSASSSIAIPASSMPLHSASVASTPASHSFFSTSSSSTRLLTPAVRTRAAHHHSAMQSAMQQSDAADTINEKPNRALTTSSALHFPPNLALSIKRGHQQLQRACLGSRPSASLSARLSLR